MQTFINSLIKGKEEEKKHTKSSSEISTNPTLAKSNPFKPRSKEVCENVKEEEKIKVFGEHKNFKFDFKVFGRSIFQNLILTASGYIENESEREAIPVKCVWRRIKRDTVIYIKDVNSNSYIPTAEDIGYMIEVEATPIDTRIHGSESAFGQYGPITIDDDMKSTIELLLTSGGTKFSCYIYDVKEQEKLTNKEIIIYINPNELKVVETDYNSAEKTLELVKYHPMNPVIKLHPYDSYRFSLKFFEFEFDEDPQANSGFNVDKLSQKPKSEYHLVAMSKQCRELIYLLIHFFLVDEKIKNSKLFSIVNYNTLPQETKVGVTDLISEIKTLREENSIIMNNVKILERMNKDLKEEMKNLEEDFQITLETINSNAYGIQQDIEKNSQKKTDNGNVNANSGSNYVNNSLNNTNNYFDLKKKYDELRDVNTNLQAKEKSLREENRGLILQVEVLKNTCAEINHENKKLKAELADKEHEVVSVKKSYNILNENKNKLQTLYDNLNEEYTVVKAKYEEANKINNDYKTGNADELNILKVKFAELQKQMESLTYENKNLIVQRNLLTNQKEVVAKEFDKIKKERNSQEEEYNNFREEIENLKSIIKEKDNINLSLNNIVENSKKEKAEYKNRFELLEIEHSALKENFDKLFLAGGDTQRDLKDNRDNTVNQSMDQSCVRISPEDYEEYDMLRKEKDEMEAVIMQLKTNNEAKDLEIKNLKMLIDNFKK